MLSTKEIWTKVIIYRLIGVGVTMLVFYLFTYNVITSIEASLVTNTVMTLVHYLMEKWWPHFSTYLFSSDSEQELSTVVATFA